MEAVINELSGQLTRVNEDLAISQDMLMVGKRELEELKSEQKEMANACNHYKQELRSCRKEREALESKIQLIETEFEKQSALNEILPQRQGQVEKMGSDLVSRFDAESKRSRQRIVNVVAKATLETFCIVPCGVFVRMQIVIAINTITCFRGFHPEGFFDNEYLKVDIADSFHASYGRVLFQM